MPGLIHRSKRRVIVLYTLSLCMLVFSCMLVYYSIIREIINYPEMRTWKFYKIQWDYQPKMLIFIAILCYLMTCCVVCFMFVYLSAFLSVCWPHLKRYFPVKIKRRTICFCKCARRQLVDILMSIHDSQCTWQPQRFNILDETTKKCIVVIANAAKTKLKCEELDISLVGSSAEGLGKPYVLELKNGYRDPLCRFLLRFFCCCLPCNTSYSSLRTDIDVLIKYTEERKPNLIEDKPCLFLLEEQMNNPGIIRIVLDSDAQNPLTCFLKNDCDGTYLSPALIRTAMLKSVNSINEHDLPASRIVGPFKHPPFIKLETKGPAIKLALFPIGQVWYWNENQKFVTFEGDFVFGIHCQQKWPKCAQKWLTRLRHWPLPSDIQHVVKGGFVLVPKSSKSSQDDDDDWEWTVSFPESETHLCPCIPKTAKACYLALKIIFKDHLSYYSEGLKTYQLKTLLFWELEKHPAELWETQNIEQCFMCLLERLKKVIEEKHCPSYWIENLNLFKNCDEKEFIELLYILQEIRSNPAPYIEDIGSFWC
ncbi:uncharacterized protein LOC117123663 [Anneissia japonica]|uniref:uncharacterized protein LOC117123663 n=1 Tax=Anneissia japonica TaxID=1529436 RepID=UPI001425B748|nr:uncharacterized protein LOC117123663 [Anneissia japonica]